jgi:hypothetical protein
VIVQAVRFEGPLGVVDRHTGTGSRAAHHAEVVMPIQTSRDMPLKMTDTTRCRSIVREAHSKKTMALKMRRPKVGAVGEHQ